MEFDKIGESQERERVKEGSQLKNQEDLKSYPRYKGWRAGLKETKAKKE